ncbi:MAG: signal peptide peptidase SppA [Alphaproteobacteria bacterium]|jgi:protease-4|nr:signal peptide peptidase SppA [Alphaproteobacteria bacterium]
MFARIGRFLLWLFAIVGIVTIIVVGAAIWSVDRWIGERLARPEPAETILLSLDLRQPIVDGPPQSPLSVLLRGAPTSIREVVESIDRARTDPRVAGLVAEFGGAAFGMATAQELRDAVTRFRDSGKPLIAYADSFAGLGGGNASFLLASAFDEIWLQPIGTIGITGFASQMPFAREALARIGIQPEVVRRGPYKTFPDILTQDGLTPENREMTAALLDSLYGQLVDGVAEGRGLEPDTVRSLIDRAPLLTEEALEAGLIDRIDHRFDLRTEIEERFGSETSWLDARSYLALNTVEAPEPQAEVALIYAVGPVVLDEDDRSPLDGGGPVIAAETTAQAIHDAIDDEDIDAIVLRIDSPGGSPVASEVVRRAVLRAAEEDKPLIVSMGGAAASGGYWIAAPARTIVAQPGTFTGSIGVFAINAASSAFWRDIGVNWETVRRGRHAGMGSLVDALSESEAQRFTALVDDIYDTFLTVVAEGRGLDRARVDEIGRGRVWTGAQAQERGLVDRLGGLDEALVVARETLDLAADAPLAVTIRPEPASPLERLAELLRSGPGLDARTRAMLARLDPLLDAVAPLAAEPGSQLLRMPDPGIRP